MASERPRGARPTFAGMETHPGPLDTRATASDALGPVARERDRVVRLFLDLAEEFEDARTHLSRPGVRDLARFAAYEEVAQEMRTLALELGVTA